MSYLILEEALFVSLTESLNMLLLQSWLFGVWASP